MMPVSMRSSMALKSIARSRSSNGRSSGTSLCASETELLSRASFLNRDSCANPVRATSHAPANTNPSNSGIPIRAAFMYPCNRRLSLTRFCESTKRSVSPLATVHTSASEVKVSPS